MKITGSKYPLDRDVLSCLLVVMELKHQLKHDSQSIGCLLFITFSIES